MSDLFDILSGGGGRRASQRQERRGDNVVHRLKVTLDEMYNGASRCSLCSGQVEAACLICLRLRALARWLAVYGLGQAARGS